MKRNESLGSSDTKPADKRLRGTPEVLDSPNDREGPLPGSPSAQISQGNVEVAQAFPPVPSVYPLVAALADSNTNALLRQESVGAILAAARERDTLERLRQALLREEILARLGQYRPLSQFAFQPTAASFLQPSYAPTNQLLGNLLAASTHSSASTGAEHEIRALEAARCTLSPASYQHLGFTRGVDPAVLQSLLRMHIPFDQQRLAGDTPSVPAMAAAAAPNQTISAGDSAAPKLPLKAGTRRCVDVMLSSDKDSLSDYQCLLRGQICFFEATMEDLEASAQGRNKPIRLGQVGIMCRNCLNVAPINRPRGSVYFPARLSGIYQAAQNMAMNHFMESCRHTPKDVKAKLAELKEQKSVVFGGGKAYWASGAEIKGVVEDDYGLSFRSDVTREN